MLPSLPYYLGLVFLCITVTAGNHGSQKDAEKERHLHKGMLQAGVQDGSKIYAETDIILGELAGSHKLTTVDIRKGFRESATNYITACDNFSKYEDNFVLTVEMGNFTDHLIPERGVTLCDLLTNTEWTGRHRFSPSDPRDPKWDGHSRNIVPSIHVEALGGSAVGYVDGGRQTLSFWGDDGGNTDHKGGCCATLPGQAPRWYRPYRLLLYPMENSWYMSLGTQPVLAVVNDSVLVEVRISDMRGERYSKEAKVAFTVNGDTKTITSSTGRYVFLGPKPEKEMENYEITAELVDGPNVKNTKKLTVSIPVMGKMPLDVIACDEKPIPALLHFGHMGSAIGPVDGGIALEEDWFATTVAGGSAQIRPVYGQFNTAQGGFLAPFTYKWMNASSNKGGVFVANVPCYSLQFYAFAVYSASEQRISVEYTFDTAAVVYFGEKRFAPHHLDAPRTGTFDIDVSEGYHQVLIKLYSEDAGSKSNQSCTTTSEFSIRVLGTGVGYAPAVMPEIPEGAYEYWSNEYLIALLYLGGRDQYLYGGLNEDIINVRTAHPKRREPFGDLTWGVLIFMDGRIPVSALNLPADKEAAILYTAFAIFNQYPTVLPLKWTFNIGGHTELYIDGKRVWGRPSDVGITQDVFTTKVSSGWHQIMVRAAATRGQSWILSYAISFDGYRLAGDISVGSILPYGVVPIKQNAPIPSLLSLQDEKTASGAIPFDPTNATASATSFSDLPISSLYKPGSLSRQSISVLGKTQEFQWVSVTNADGVWGESAFGGNFNQYWALSLYATENMDADVHIVVHGGFALWLDGALKDSASVKWSKEYITKLSLSAGWHQVIAKLKANNSFHLIDTNDGTTTWTKSNSVCSSKGHMELCSQADLCPFGVPRPGAIPVGSASSFVPVSDRPNAWVQVFAQGGDSTKLCQSWRDAHSGTPPPWGEKEEEVSERRYVPCCGGTPRPSMSISIEPPASGELGYTFDVRFSLQAPVITIKNAVALTQIVTMTTETSDARIEYALGDAKFNPYTRPLEITKDVEIVARAVKDDRASPLSYLSVVVPKTQGVDRTDCVANATCPLIVTGVDPGWSIAILTTNIHGSKSAPYKNKSYAMQQQVSTNFSGVLTVGNDNDVIVPPLGGGTYQMFLYAAGQDKGSVTDKLLAYSTVTIDPREVLGTQETLFHIHGGVMVDDAVLLPYRSSKSSVECSSKTCLNELKENKDHMAFIASKHDAYVRQDLHDFSGEINCMCLCLSCSKESGAQVGRHMAISDGKVISQSVSIRVIAEPLPNRETVKAVRPTVVFDDSILELSGVFDTTVSYTVQFTPTPTASKNSITPSCAVQRVVLNSITCKMAVNPGTMGDWNILLIHGETKVPFAPSADQVLRMYPPTPRVTSASGICARSSASCVNGTVITFFGANFNLNGVALNEIRIDGALAMNRIRCNVTEVSGVLLSCTLTVTQDNDKGKFPISMRIRTSPTEWGSYVSAGFLVLGEGSNAAGWIPPAAPDPAPGPSGKNKYRYSIVMGVLLSLALLVILGGVCMLCCGKGFGSRDKGYGDEMLTMDEQLLRAEVESVRSLNYPTKASGAHVGFV